MALFIRYMGKNVGTTIQKNAETLRDCRMVAFSTTACQSHKMVVIALEGIIVVCGIISDPVNE